MLLSIPGFIAYTIFRKIAIFRRTSKGQFGFIDVIYDIIVNDITATYLRAHADAVHKTPSELVDEMVKERIAAAV